MTEEYEILKQIKQDKETLIVDLLTDDMKRRVLEIEMERLNELIPLINEGVNDAFKEKNIVILIRDLNKNQRKLKEIPSLTLVTESGKVIGEEIFDKEEIGELKERNDVYFISDNFVTYTNIGETEGEKQFFKVSAITSKLFTNENLNKYVDSLTVAIPSTSTDHYIREHYGYSPDDKIGTIILGFTV